MKCINCRFYDMNDVTHASGTCEPQDEDFHCAHDCNLSDSEIQEIESITGKKQADKGSYHEGGVAYRVRGSKTGLRDYKLNEICLGDKVSLYGLKGIVIQECGAYGIGLDKTIPWDMLYSMIQKETGCDNSPCFCNNDNFISFWEIAWNYNCEENYLSMVEIIN